MRTPLLYLRLTIVLAFLTLSQSVTFAQNGEKYKLSKLKIAEQKNITIKGNIKQLALYGSMVDAFAFQYRDLVTNERVTIPINKDTAGNFKVTFQVNSYQQISLVQGYKIQGEDIIFGGLIQLYFFVSPGSDMELNFYVSKDHKIRTADFKGKMADINNQKVAYTNKTDLDPKASFLEYSELDSIKPDGYPAFKQYVTKKLKEGLAYNANYFREHKTGVFLRNQLDMKMRYTAANFIFQALSRTKQKDPDLLNFLSSNGIVLNNPAAFGNDNYKLIVDQYYLILEREAMENYKAIKVTFPMLAEYLLKAHPEFPSVERSLFVRIADTVNRASGADRRNFYDNYMASYGSEYSTDYSNRIVFDYISKNNDPFIRDIYLTKLLRTQLKFNQLVYINSLIDDYKKIVNNNPVKAQFLKEYNEAYREFYKDKPSAKTVYNDAKTLPGTAFFQGIIDKYKGKVVYVDVWATWCVPCLMEMGNSKKLREKLAGKDVVFLYICINSPTESIWKTLVAGHKIEGENYFLSYDQSDDFSRQFNVKTIPRYLIFDKTGKAANEEAPRPSASSTINRINTLLK
ncbi:thiol-disulfide isomerase/thioredoxin [Pedobacter sp. UYP24]